MALAQALLERADQLLPAWLPGGSRHGSEYKCASIMGGAGRSLSISLQNGVWADFAGSEKGGDLLSLFAAINQLSMGEAAVRVARQEGLEDVAELGSGAAGGSMPMPMPPPRPPGPLASHKRDLEGWRTQMPVPAEAPEPVFRHQYRAVEDIVHKAAYRCDGFLLGFVVRFRTNDGGKETLPYTWCVSERDGSAKWHWRQWDQPRPLFYPGGTHPKGRTVILVEGEKKAEALQALLDAGAPGVYCVASWPGGCKAWQKAAWPWLEGSTVLLWPDCDAKRVPLTKAERDQCLDDVALEVAKAAKPLLPAVKQPGMAAMLGIGALLRDAHGCTVSMLPIPEPGAVVDGWDCGDAIEVDGWDLQRVLEFFGRASPLVAEPLPEPAAKEEAARKPKRDAPDDPEPAATNGERPW